MERLKLVQEDEEHVYEIGESQIFYKRLRGHIRENILKRNTKRGQVNWLKAAHEFVEAAITRWKKIDLGGEEFEFAPDRIKEFVDRLPAEHVDRLGELVAGDTEQLEDELGNSGSTFGNSTTIKD